MFIVLQAKDRDGREVTLKINTSQIAFLVGRFIHMANTAVFELDSKNLKQLEETLCGPVSEASPGASTHTETLLNELHKLTGGKGDAKPTSDRKARLKTRMKDFTEDDMKLAAKNLGEDEFMQGANDSGKRYGTIDYLLRTSANVNKYLDVPDKKPKSMF